MLSADALVAEGVHQYLVSKRLAHLGDGFGHDFKANLEHAVVGVDAPFNRFDRRVGGVFLRLSEDCVLAPLFDDGNFAAAFDDMPSDFDGIHFFHLIVRIE